MKRKRSLKAIRRELDTVFARYIRSQNMRCVTCGAVTENGHAGHFVPRQYLATRWDVRNCHKQCVYCNVYRHGNLIEYTLFMQKRYGQSVIDELLQAKRQTVKLTREWLEERLNYFKSRL